MDMLWKWNGKTCNNNRPDRKNWSIFKNFFTFQIATQFKPQDISPLFCTEYRVQGKEFRVQSTGHRVRSSEYIVKSALYRVQYTEAQSTDVDCAGLDLCLTVYSVVPTEQDKGIIEFVQDAETICRIQMAESCKNATGDIAM